MKRSGTAAVLALSALGCNLRPARETTGRGAPCYRSSQCRGGGVCFLGECRGAAAALSVVEAEVRPPNGLQLAILQRGGIDLRQSTVVDFQLSGLLSVSGRVLQYQDASNASSVAVPDAGVTLIDRAPAIPDRAQSFGTVSDAAGGFTLFLPPFPPSTWDLVVSPKGPNPPFRSQVSTESAAAFQLPTLPNPGAYANVSGILAAAGVRLGGARVTAVEPSSGALLAAPAITDANNGNFTLVLPPGPPAYNLVIGPQADAGGSPCAPVPSYRPIPKQGLNLDTVDLGPLPPPVLLVGSVQDLGGSPVPAARVYAVSLDEPNWILSRSTTAGANGSFQLCLRAGRYAVEAAPDPDPALPGLSGDLPGITDARLPLPPSAPLFVLKCPPKSQGFGVIYGPDGRTVGSGTQITATRLPDRLVSGRTAQAFTDANGNYGLVADSGRYRLEIVPPSASGLARMLAVVDLGGDGGAQLPPLQLPQPLEVVGTVRGPDGATIRGASVEYFALDSTGERSTLIGRGMTDSKGLYRAVLPDVRQPVTPSR